MRSPAWKSKRSKLKDGACGPSTSSLYQATLGGVYYKLQLVCEPALKVLIKDPCPLSLPDVLAGARVTPPFEILIEKQRGAQRGPVGGELRPLPSESQATYSSSEEQEHGARSQQQDLEEPGKRKKTPEKQE